MIKFANLNMLWFFPVILIALVSIFYSRKLRKQNLHNFIGDILTNKLMPGYKPELQRVKEYVLVVAIIFISIALIGPKVGQKLQKIKRKGIDAVIALDISTSMNAEDVAPSRLELTKYEAGKFIDNLRGDRIGLVAFAGVSYLHCPLTLDYGAAKLFLNAIDSKVIGVQGTAIADAINTAIETFKGKEKKHKAIIVISDGEDHEGNIDEVVKLASDNGIVIYSIGIGSYSGAPIPVEDKDGNISYKRDKADKVITSALEEGTLKKIASISGGKYFNMSEDNQAFQKVYNEIRGMEKKELNTHKYSDYQNRYQIFLIFGLLLLFFEYFIPEKSIKIIDKE